MKPALVSPVWSRVGQCGLMWSRAERDIVSESVSSPSDSFGLPGRSLVETQYSRD